MKDLGSELAALANGEGKAIEARRSIATRALYRIEELERRLEELKELLSSVTTKMDEPFEHR